MVISKLTQCDWWINWLIKPIISLKPPTFLSKSAVFLFICPICKRHKYNRLWYVVLSKKVIGPSVLFHTIKAKLGRNMSFENILYSTEGPLALITINRAEKHNAISLATLDELNEAVDLAAENSNVKVIAITGAGGRSFASGSDLSEVLDRDFKKALEPIVQGLADKLERTPKPTIAAIDGICMGGGLEVALGCDLRIATPGSKFATPEGRLGIIPGGGATARLPRIVGKGWGMEMMLMGEPIDADRALQIGLVTRLVESDQLLEEVAKMADHLSQFAPFVPRTMKAMVHFGMEASLAGALMFEKYAQGALVQTEDKKEGIEAFLEKRKPSFKGK